LSWGRGDKNPDPEVSALDSPKILRSAKPFSEEFHGDGSLKMTLKPDPENDIFVKMVH
jgi:hypothetical protein